MKPWAPTVAERRSRDHGQHRQSARLHAPGRRPTEGSGARGVAGRHERYLGQQGPTDVLSFLLDEADGCLEGEVVVSAQTAVAQAGRFGWSAADELLLYVVHGALHLLGYDDATCPQRRAMRRRERRFVARLGLAGRYRREKFGRGCARPAEQSRQGRGREPRARQRRAEDGGRRGSR